MAMNIAINTDTVSVHQRIGRLQELNKLLPYMHCLCHKQDSPLAMKAVTEYTPFKMCKHVLVAIPLNRYQFFPP